MTASHSRLGLGLAALVLFAPLVDGGTTYVPATVIRLGALALAVGWLAGAVREDGTWRRPTPIDLPVIAFFLLAALSTATSPYVYQSLQAFHTLAAGALVLAVSAEVARERRSAGLVAWVIVVAGAAQALLALLQWTSGVDRPAGTYFNPNHLATALAMALALLLACAPGRGVGRVAALAGVALLAAGLVASRSRGGILAALAGAGLVGWYRWRWRAVAAGAGALLLVALAPNPLTERIRDAHGADPLAYTRLAIWRSALERAGDHPLGVGLNMFAKTSQRYAFPVEGELARYGRRAESAHNDYLELLAEVGVPGLAAALAALGAFACRVRRRLRDARAGGGAGDPLVLGAAGAVTAVAAQALVDSPLAVPGLVVQAAALAGVALGTTGPGPAIEATPSLPGLLARGRLPLIRGAIVAAGLIAALGIARHGAAYLAGRQAAAHRDAGDLASARSWLERAARLAPDSAAFPDAMAAAAVMTWRSSRSPLDAMAAERLMQRAMRLDRQNAQRYARLAEVYRAVRPLDPAVRRAALLRARTLYEEAERLDPHAAGYAYERADVLAALGEPAAEIAALERAVALEPNLVRARLRLARIRLARGERAEAAVQYAAIDETFARYEALRPLRGESPFAPWLLGGVDRAVVKKEAAGLAAGRS